MNCLECRELLQKRMDGAAITAETLEPHLSQCATCRDQHAAAVRVLETLKKLPEPKLHANFARTMAAGLLADRRHRAQRMRRRVFVTMALAASVLLVLFLAYSWLPYSGQGVPKEPFVKDGPKKEQPKDPPKPRVEPQHAEKPEPPGPFTKLTDRVADTTRDHAMVVLAAANLDGMGQFPVGDIPVNPQVREASQEVTDGVRTVTRSARKAFDFFARELPMPDLGEGAN